MRFSLSNYGTFKCNVKASSSVILLINDEQGEILEGDDEMR